MKEGRREFLGGMGSAAAIALAGCAADGGSRGPREPDGRHERDQAEVTPGEDLMQEHGLLERVLLVYDQVAARIERGVRIDTGVVERAAGIVRHFVEEYHEQLEERHLFPRLEAAGREVQLVAILRRQHERGRELTAEVARLARAGTDSPRLAEVLRLFERMYRPHAAREDTVLFPAFRSLVGGAVYRELGEQFEREEHQRFGAGGFQATVAAVGRLEEALDIADLSRFTP